jgi:hypothetical protein
MVPSCALTLTLAASQPGHRIPDIGGFRRTREDTSERQTEYRRTRKDTRG